VKGFPLDILSLGAFLKEEVEEEGVFGVANFTNGGLLVEHLENLAVDMEVDCTG
jgi:hypothetical protein